MARHESDREDLFSEAAGLVRRLEGRSDAGEHRGARPTCTTIIAGFRADGALAVYFGADPMFQFDESGRLRRAFMDGCLYRCQGTTLARLTRSRSDSETALLRHDLTEPELADFRGRLLQWIEPLVEALQDGRFCASRRVPPGDSSLEAEIAQRLRQACNAADWIAPALRGKR